MGTGGLAPRAARRLEPLPRLGPLEAFPYSWYLAGGLALGAGVLALAAVLYRQRWPLAFAAPILVAAAFAVTGTLERQVLGTLGLFAVAVALGVLYLPIVWRRPRRVASLAEPGLAEVLSALTGLFVAWAGLLILFRYSPSASELWSAWNGWELAGASLLVAGAARLATASRRHPWDAEAAGVAAGLLFGVAAIGILDAVGATFDWYPLGLLAAAVVTVLWARRVPSLDAPAGVHAVASLVLAVALALADYGDPLLLLVSFGAIAAAGRVAAVRAPIGGGVLLLLALLGGLSFVVLVYFLPVHWSLQAAVWIAFAGATLLAWRVPLLGVSRTAARIVAWPILAAAFLAGIASAIWVGIAEPKLMTDPEFVVILAGARWASLALIGASLVHALGGRTPRRRAAPVVAAALASFVYAPINILVQGSADRLWRPDVEVALLAIVLALVLPLGRETRERRASLPPPPLGFAGTWPIVMIACALLLTAGMLRNASTPLAVLAATLAVFVLVVRDHRPGLGHLFGGGLITTAFAFVAWLRPTEGPLAEELLLLLAATAALVAPVLWGIAAGLRGAPPGGWQERLLAELPGTAVFAGATAFVCAALDTLLYANQPAGGLALAFAFVAYGIPGLGAALSARRTDRPWLIHLAVACGLGLYAFTVQRTELLSILDGKHLHALIGIGGALLLLSEYKRDRTADFLAMDGLLLAVPAVFIYAPRALIPEASAGSVSALALTSIAAAYGARRLAWPALWWVAVALLNLMLFAFWRRHGIVDPAFYGIPPGLSLVAGAVILRNKIARPAALAMLVPGLALLYGSVAIQVFRVGNPVHALVLFGMGLATVALGFVFRRNAWLVTGMTVIVLDVVAYLASHGFETDFFGAALLVAAGLCVFAVAALATARRRRAAETQPSERDANT